MSDSATPKLQPLNPQARAVRSALVGSPVLFTDGNDWIIPSLPVGPIGDPILEAMEKLGRIETEIHMAEARQTNTFRTALETVVTEEDEKEARKVYDGFQDRIGRLERTLTKEHANLIHLAMSLHYRITIDEVVRITGLTQIRHVLQCLSGAPQLAELEEGIKILRGGTGN